jgi:hypothetical protein
MSASKYNPEKLKELEENVESGMTVENSAVLAFGIDRSTYYLWMKEDSILTEQEKFDFTHAIEVGKAKRNSWLIQAIKKAVGEGDGKLAMDLLKRVERKDYGDKVEQETYGKDGGPIETKNDTTLSVDEQLQKALNDLKTLQRYTDATSA